MNKEILLERFNQKYLIDTDTGCWYWKGALRTGGYGVMGAGDGKLIAAHRLSYILFNGEIPEDRDVCHKCDNRRCVNPEHLFLCTAKENVQDSIKKGRFRNSPDSLNTKWQWEVENNKDFYLDRLLSCKTVSDNGCWEWHGVKNGEHNSINIFGNGIPVHRISYVLFKGKLPKRTHVLRTCNNPTCINPDHLILPKAMKEKEYKENLEWTMGEVEMTKQETIRFIVNYVHDNINGGMLRQYRDLIYNK